MLHSNIPTGQYSNVKGFSMIEVIVAVFILSLAAFGCFILIQQTIIAASLNQMQLTAYYLGQEGVEIVRNIRDTNWLQKQVWTTGLAVGGGEQEADYQSTALTASQNRYLKTDSNGFYNYASGTETKFKRKIIVTQEAGGYLQVRVIVEWQEREKEHSIEVINLLYNWYVS